MSEKPFPLLEMHMTAQGLRVSLTNEAAQLAATVPTEMMNGIVEKWKAFQDGSETQMAYSRHYTGDWPDLLQEEMKG